MSCYIRPRHRSPSWPWGKHRSLEHAKSSPQTVFAHAKTYAYPTLLLPRATWRYQPAGGRNSRLSSNGHETRGRLFASYLWMVGFALTQKVEFKTEFLQYL